MKRNLGLDVGTNSVGWALTEQNFELKEGKILGIGSRIIPMDQGTLSTFGSGGTIETETSQRTKYRGSRRLHQRFLLRRERLHRVLNILDLLPKHYAETIDFVKRKGQFLDDSEVKLPYRRNDSGEFEFIFNDSYQEMLEDFKINQPDILKDGKSIPKDLTIYYLRKKALEKRISDQELAWILLNFNQKRGYYQLRGEDDDEKEGKLVEFKALKVINVEDTGEKKGKDQKWYKITFENGWSFNKPSSTLLEWIGKTKEFIITTEVEEDGVTPKLNKDGEVKRSFRTVDSTQDWIAIKKSTEQKIEESKQTVGEYIYKNLLSNPYQKVRGNLVRTIERNYYKKELQEILKQQIIENPKLRDKELLAICAEELYPNNYAHQANLKNTSFLHLFINDIIFYQRPLKSKKSLISGCPYECKIYKNKNKETDKYEHEPLKAIAKSNPLFQEFRLWQFISNLKIYQREKLIDGKLQSNVDVTKEYLKDENSYFLLFNWLNDRDFIEQKHLFGIFLKQFKLKEAEYRWNYVEEKPYPCNETRNLLIKCLKSIDGLDIQSFLTKEVEEKLWHLLYSINDKKEIEKALQKYANKKGLNEEIFKNAFIKAKPFKQDYGSYSSKALKKLLPLISITNENEIDQKWKDRIDAIYSRLDSIEHDKLKINSIADDDISKACLNSFVGYAKKYSGLKIHQACYVVYNRFSEVSEINRWTKPEDIKRFLKEGFKQHSLRNPIVERVIAETLRVVHDIWMQYGKGAENYFDEIHVELGRDMKNPKADREKMSKAINESEKTNQRIQMLLLELKNSTNDTNIRPYSPSQQEILKIYEESVLNTSIADESIQKIRSINQPSQSEINKYKLWFEEQKCRSPYTGEVISLSKLFSTKYEIEHIIPQSRYFDDSFSNKVISETEVNKLKDKLTGYEFILKFGGQIIETGNGKSVRIFTKDEYEDFVSRNYRKGSKKHQLLLSQDIPEKFIERQLNDTRYISKVVKNLLGNLVREDGEEEGTPKRMIMVQGAVTATMRRDWGLEDIWSKLVAPRFIRMNNITKSELFGNDVEQNGKRFFRCQLPVEYGKLEKKRLDHRHHALDALVIATITRNHVNYLNNYNAKEDNFRHDLRKLLCDKTKVENNGNYNWTFKKPWANFTQETDDSLGKVVVSFKQNLRVINKTTNKYQKWENKDGKLLKSIVTQDKGTSWSIRKQMHDPMPYGLKKYNFDVLSIKENLGKVELIKDDFSKQQVEKLLMLANKNKSEAIKLLTKNPIKDIYGNIIDKCHFKVNCEKYSKRQPFNKLSSNSYDKVLKSIYKVADYTLQIELIKHLNTHKQNIEFAFSPEGIEEFNNSREKPINSLRIFESGSKRFRLGNKIGNRMKYMEAAEGTNLYFAIYHNENGNRSYKTIPLNIVIERLKQGLVPVPEKEENTNAKLLFYLSPNDLVYVPTPDELDNHRLVDYSNLNKEQIKRIYKMEKASGVQCYFIQHHIARLIKEYDAKTQKGEFGSQNKMEKSIDDLKITEISWKLEIDKLGNLKKI